MFGSVDVSALVMQLDLKRCIALRGAVIPLAAIQLICDKKGSLASLRNTKHSDR